MCGCMCVMSCQGTFKLLFILAVYSLMTSIVCHTGMQTVGLKSFIERNPGVIAQLFPTREMCQISAAEFIRQIEVPDSLTERNQTALDFLFQYIDNLQGQKQGAVQFENVEV